MGPNYARVTCPLYRILACVLSVTKSAGVCSSHMMRWFTILLGILSQFGYEPDASAVSHSDTLEICERRASGMETHQPRSHIEEHM